MLLAVLSVCSEEELTEADIDSTGEVEIRTELPPMSEDIQRRRQEIKNKILAVGKVQRMFQVLRSVYISCWKVVCNMLMSFCLVMQAGERECYGAGGG